jgi:hypothetical protein
MSVEADLRTYLLTLGTVTALVGTGNSARIRPDRLQQGDDPLQPAIIVEVDDEQHKNDLDGKGGLVYSTVTLRCRARTKAVARSLAEAIRVNGTDPGTGLAGRTGLMNGTSYGAVLEDEQTSFTAQAEGSDEGWYDVFCNYILSHAETT